MGAEPADLSRWAGGRAFCVTGGRGSLGRRLTARLLELGARRVVSIGRTPPLTGAAPNQRLQELTGDALDLGFLTRSLTGLDLVFHLAGSANAGRCQADPPGCFRANALTAAMAGQACLDTGTPRLLLASTSHVYGPTAKVPAGEDQPPAPASVYAAAKLAAEEWLRSLALSGKIGCDVLRLCNVYGGRHDPETVIGRAMAQARAGGPLELYNLGAMRDFMHADDAVEGMLRVAAAPLEPGGFRIVNLSTGRADSVERAARILAELAGKPGAGLEVRQTGQPRPDAFHLDNTGLKRLTGWQPALDLEQGLEKAWKELCPPRGGNQT